eukprot:6851513-Alexandrium_andersonii.AAC.1
MASATSSSSLSRSALSLCPHAPEALCKRPLSLSLSLVFAQQRVVVTEEPARAVWLRLRAGTAHVTVAVLVYVIT